MLLKNRNVERGIVKILFKYRYFQDLLIDISQILLIDIDIFQNHHIDIDIDIFGVALSISISIFSNMTISILISIFFKSVDISTIDMSYRYIEQGYRYPTCLIFAQVVLVVEKSAVGSLLPFCS